jgi:hypothetical protein
MKTIAITIIFIVLLTGMGSTVNCQQKSQFLSITLYNHSFSSQLFTKPQNLSFSIEYNFGINKKVRNQWFVPIVFNFINHQYVYNAFGLSTGIRYKYNSKYGIVAGSGFTIGYLRSFDKYQRYAKNSQGKYEKAPDAGRGSLLPALNVQLGYDFSHKTNLPIELFIRYQLAVQMPFIKDVAGLITYMGFQFGVSYFPFKNEKKTKNSN